MATNRKKAEPKAPTQEDTALKEKEAQEATQESQEDQGSTQEGQTQEETQEAQEKGKEDTPEPFTPYEATVTVPLAVIRRGKTPRPEDKPIGTLTRGDRVTVTDSVDGFAMLANGTYIKAVYLERKE